MKNIKVYLLAIALSSGLLLQSCEAVKNTNNTQRGVAAGAVAGGVIGGILGNNMGKGGNTAVGAIIGAAVGGAAGGIIGNSMDKQAERIENTLPGAQVVRSEEGIQVILDENSDVRFEYNKSDLTPSAKTNLDKLVTIFNEYPDTNLMIAGYTDGIGSEAYNLTLSEKRANSVKDYLISRGISPSRLTSKGFGKADPIATNETDAGRAQNRRVEFYITANQKMIDDAQRQAEQGK